MIVGIVRVPSNPPLVFFFLSSWAVDTSPRLAASEVDSIETSQRCDSRRQDDRGQETDIRDGDGGGWKMKDGR